MAAIAGKGGSVKIGAGPSTVAGVKNWSIDAQMGTAETTALGMSWKEFISTVGEWSGTMECIFRIHDDTNGQTALQTAFLAGTEVAFKGYVNASNYYSGNVILTGMPVTVEVDGAVGVSFPFQGTGALAYN
jgi:predicted secreted protein